MLARYILLTLLAMLMLGCAQPAGIIFPPLQKPILFPPPPDVARVRYVGQLATSADLKPPVPFGQGLADAMFGKKTIASMLSPYALCTDNADRLFVADSNAQTVHVFDLKTRKYDQWKPASGTKRFSQPVGIAYDPAGKLFVADAAAGSIYVFDNVGRSIGEIHSDAIQRPCGLAFDAANHR